MNEVLAQAGKATGEKFKVKLDEIQRLKLRNATNLLYQYTYPR
jgi:hypothetical protein